MYNIENQNGGFPVLKDNKLYKILRLISTGTLLIHVYNKIISYRAVSYKNISNSDARTYKWSFGPVYYEVKGKGEPLLLLHDCDPCFSGYEWSDIKEKLSETYTVYIVDLPGCGRSCKNNMTYTFFLFVRFLNDFIEDIIKEKANVITSGYSGTFTIMSTAYKPENIGKIICINPPAVNDLHKNAYMAIPLIRNIIDLPIAGTFIYNLYADKEAIRSRFSNQYFYDPRKVNDKLIEHLYKGSHTGGYNKKFLYSSLISGYLTTDIIHPLRKLDNGITLIVGEMYPDKKNIINSYLRYNNRTETFQIPFSSRYPHLETPDQLLKLINMKEREYEKADI